MAGAPPAGGPRAALGRDKERLASDYLVGQGLQPVARNHRCRFGEIDLVMRDGATLVFVEVRYRGSGRFGGPAATVDIRKQRRIALAAADYLKSHRSVLPCRFDVVAIGAQDQIQWLKDAFSARF